MVVTAEYPNLDTYRKSKSQDGWIIHLELPSIEVFLTLIGLDANEATANRVNPLFIAHCFYQAALQRYDFPLNTIDFFVVDLCKSLIPDKNTSLATQTSAAKHLNMNNIELPNIAAQRIFNLLPSKDILSVLQVSKNWNQVFSHDYIWKSRFFPSYDSFKNADLHERKSLLEPKSAYDIVNYMLRGYLTDAEISKLKISEISHAANKYFVAEDKKSCTLVGGWDRDYHWERCENGLKLREPIFMKLAQNNIKAEVVKISPKLKGFKITMPVENQTFQRDFKHGFADKDTYKYEIVGTFQHQPKTVSII